MSLKYCLKYCPVLLCKGFLVPVMLLEEYRDFDCGFGGHLLVFCMIYDPNGSLVFNSLIPWSFPDLGWSLS